MENKRLIIILAVVAILLLIPLVGMQFTTEVNWDVLDFAIMGMLLLGTGLLCELFMRIVSSIQGRIIICCAVLLLFFLSWAELAVGVFGTLFAGS